MKPKAPKPQQLKDRVPTPYLQFTIQKRPELKISHPELTVPELGAMLGKLPFYICNSYQCRTLSISNTLVTLSLNEAILLYKYKHKHRHKHNTNTITHTITGTDTDTYSFDPP